MQFSLFQHYFFGILTFALGTSLGSFANVAILRQPLGYKSLLGDSKCPSCQKKLGFINMIPVLSWILLKGRCKFCEAKFSIQYPLVELFSGLLLFYCWFNLSLFSGLKLFSICFLLLIIGLIDLKFWLIPYFYSLSLIALGLIFGFLENKFNYYFLTSIAAFAFIFILGKIFTLYFRYKKRIAQDEEAMGLGDSFLLAGIGASLGFLQLPMVLFLSAFQGLIIALILKFLYPDQEAFESHNDDWAPPRNSLPFGAFLALAAIEILIFA